jgi:hypothetical protein
MTEDYVADVRDTSQQTFYTWERNNMIPSHIREKKEIKHLIIVFFVQFLLYVSNSEKSKMINFNASIT